MYDLFTGTMSIVGAKYTATINPGTVTEQFSYSYTVEGRTYTDNRVRPGVRQYLYELLHNPYDTYKPGSQHPVTVVAYDRRSRLYRDNRYWAYLDNRTDFITPGIMFAVGISILLLDDRRRRRAGEIDVTEESH